MTREEQIKAAAKKTTGLFSYRNGYSTAEDAFAAGATWADANPCMPGMVVKIPERSREEIKELLANWEGTLVVGDDISPSPWISVKDGLPSVNNNGESKMVFVRVINKHSLANLMLVFFHAGEICIRATEDYFKDRYRASQEYQQAA